MAWFKRVEKGIVTPTEQKKETPDGLWYKCPECKTVATMAEHKRLLHVCGNCGHHDRIDAAEKAAVSDVRHAAAELAGRAAERILSEFPAEADATLIDRSIQGLPAALASRRAA